MSKKTAARNERSMASLKAELAAAQKEIESLRATLNLGPSTEETWATTAPQHLRDQMAANALIAEKLDEMRALLRLGFDVKATEGFYTWKPEARAIAKRIFGTDGVRAILETDMQDANANKMAIVQSLVQKARGDGPDSVRAAQQLAKMADWNEGDKKVAAAGANNFMLMFGGNPAALTATGGNGAAVALADPDRTIDAAEFLVHEPSAEGEKIRDEDKE